ncbi:retrovirus-related pol polyprotein from transposon TNT 1-94 [Tanacetum coccineum]
MSEVNDIRLVNHPTSEWPLASDWSPEISTNRPRFLKGDRFSADSGKEYLELTYSARMKVQFTSECAIMTDCAEIAHNVSTYKRKEIVECVAQLDIARTVVVNLEMEASLLADLVMKGLSECKALESNIRRIRVKDIVKEVEDYLKTYSSAGMDINWNKHELKVFMMFRRDKKKINTPKGATKGIFSLSTYIDRPLSNQWLYKFALKLDYSIQVLLVQRMWNDLILAHEGPSDTRDTKIAALRLKFNDFKSLEGEKVNGTFTRLKCLLNDLENNNVTIPQAEVNVMFVNSLPRKWLSMNQTQRVNNSFKNDSLTPLYGKYNYEEGLIDQIHESETQRFTIQDSSLKALISIHQFQDSDSDVKEDKKTSNKFMADLNAEYHERALLANQKRFYKRSSRNSGNHQKDYKGKYKGLKVEMDVLTKRIDDMTKRKSEKGKMDKEKSEKEDEPSVGKANARSGQWVNITMKKVYRLLSMTDGDERKHVLDYTHVDLHYVEDQRKNLVSKFNLLKQEISLHKSELFNLKNTVSINCFHQNKVIRINLENESLNDEIIDLKKVIEKWTCSKVTLDQLLSEKVPGNIIKALGGKGRRKEKISSKEVVFTKADESSSTLALEITSDSEFECESQEPLPPLLKLIGATPSGTS